MKNVFGWIAKILITMILAFTIIVVATIFGIGCLLG